MPTTEKNKKKPLQTLTVSGHIPYLVVIDELVDRSWKNKVINLFVKLHLYVKHQIRNIRGFLHICDIHHDADADDVVPKAVDHV